MDIFDFRRSVIGEDAAYPVNTDDGIRYLFNEHACAEADRWSNDAIREFLDGR